MARRTRRARGSAMLAMLIAIVIVAAIGGSLWIVMGEATSAVTRRVVRCMVRFECGAPGPAEAPAAAPGPAPAAGGWSGFELVAYTHAAAMPPGMLAPGRSRPDPSPRDVVLASAVLAQGSQVTDDPAPSAALRPIVDGARDRAAMARCLGGDGGAPATVFFPGILNDRDSAAYRGNAAAAQAAAQGPCVIGVPNRGGVVQGLEASAESRTVDDAVDVLRAVAARGRPVDVVVHSNGATVLAAALDRLAGAGVHPPLGDVTLVAPNVATGVLEKLEAATQRLTVVISGQDPVLRAAVFNDCRIRCVIDFVDAHPEVRGAVLQLPTHSFIRQLERARRLLLEEEGAAARLGRRPRFPVYDIEDEDDGTHALERAG